MRFSPYLYEGYRITIWTVKISGDQWRGVARIESIPPTAEIKPVEIFQGLTFNTEGQAHRETKKLAERQIEELILKPVARMRAKARSTSDQG
jgi:hypothetical protein